jgi:DNA polymerase-3 subunit delta'
MAFEIIINQERPKDILHKAIVHQRIPHAYLFSGPEGVGKEALAIELAKAVFCRSGADRPCGSCSSCRRVGNFSHPDFIFIFPMPKGTSPDEEREILQSMSAEPYLRRKPWAAPGISIDRIREVRHVSVLKPLEGFRVVVIADCDGMTTEAANALLKILEEPPDHMHLVLTTARPNALLPTIVSRCQEVRFGLLSDRAIENALMQRKGVSGELARLLARIAQGSYRRALEALQEDLASKRDFVVEVLRACLRDNLTRIQMVEEIMQNYDKPMIKDILSLLLLWFRDAMVLDNRQPQSADDDLVNVDKYETLVKFIGAFESIDYNDIFATIEQSIEYINRNIQLNLILLVLFTSLHRYMKIKGRKL